MSSSAMRQAKASLIVFKDFPARYRDTLSGLTQADFTRTPSMPMTELTLDQAIQLALQRHQAQDYAQAEMIYRQILQVQPQEANALHLLGLLLQHQGQPQAAVELIRRSVALLPHVAELHCNLANAYLADYIAGKIDRVDVAYMKFISAARQMPVVETLLPLSSVAPAAGKAAPPPAAKVEYEFLPGKWQRLTMPFNSYEAAEKWRALMAGLS